MLVDQVSIFSPYAVVVGCISYTSYNKLKPFISVTTNQLMRWFLLIFCFRWMVLGLNTAVPNRREWVPLPAAHTGTAFPGILPKRGTMFWAGTCPRHIMAKEKSQVLGLRAVQGGRRLVSLPLHPFCPPHLFLPRRWLPPFACLRDHRGVRCSRFYQYLPFQIAEDATWPRRGAAAWGDAWCWNYGIKKKNSTTFRVTTSKLRVLGLRDSWHAPQQL